MQTLSPITQNTETGGYKFTLDGKKYWTNENGQGLWCYTHQGTYDAQTKEPILEPTQILGTMQIDLSTSNRRAKVLHWLLGNTPEYKDFLAEEDMQDSLKAVQLFDRYQK